MFEVSNLSYAYDKEVVIKNISFKFNSRNIVGIIGPNGAGKSTLIKSILNLIKKDSGKVTYNNIDVTKTLKDISYIPQRNNINLDFPITVLDVVLMGLYPKKGLIKRFNKLEINKAKEVLKRVGMEKYINTQIGSLSGGQQQRVFLARSIIQDSKVLFLDEPFVGIDIKTEELIINILKELKEENKLIFIVHHDLTKVNHYFDELIIINKEIIAFGKVKDVFNETNMLKAYNFKLEKGV